MKKTVIFLIAVSALVFIGVASFRPAALPEAPKSIPDSVFAVMSKSCVGCHSTDGNKMAKSKLNFDNWDTYTPERRTAKAQAITKVLNKGEMPPTGFRKNYPDKVPTPAEVKKVVSWASSGVK